MFQEIVLIVLACIGGASLLHLLLLLLFGHRRKALYSRKGSYSSHEDSSSWTYRTQESLDKLQQLEEAIRTLQNQVEVSASGLPHPKGLSDNGKNAYSALYAPASVETMHWFKIQVHLYPKDNVGLVEEKAKSMDRHAERMDCNPLPLKLVLGTRVKAELTIFDEGVFVKQSTRYLVWNGELTSNVFLAKVTDRSLTSIAGEVTLSVEDVPVGVLAFVIEISPSPVLSNRNKMGIGRLYKMAFISYSHLDMHTAATMAAVLRAQEIPYFWDRQSLGPGAKFNDVIKNCIDEADLFLLLWSQNAAQSDYVKKEYQHALQRANLRKESGATALDIKAFSIEPFADPPSDLKDQYNFFRIQSRY